MLLPPSEAQDHRRPRHGRSGAAAADGPLGAARRRRRSTRSPRSSPATRSAAAEALLLPAGVAAAALAATRGCATARPRPRCAATPAVVYDGLDVGNACPRPSSASPAAACSIFSGLFGVVRGDEPVPDYRVPGKAVLPGLGVAVDVLASATCTAALRDVLRRGLVVDLRSSDYAAMWRPERDTAARTVTVRVLSRRRVAATR